MSSRTSEIDLLFAATGDKVEQQGVSGVFYWPNRKGKKSLQGKNPSGQSTANTGRELWGTPHLLTVTEFRDAPPCEDCACLTSAPCRVAPSGPPRMEAYPHTANLRGCSHSTGTRRLCGSGFSDCIQMRTRLALAKINVCTGCCCGTE